ncbi:MAG: Dabb family protein [Chitinophagaceae bacterium]
MKIFIYLSTILLIVTTGNMKAMSQEKKASSTSAKKTTSTPLLRHVVIFKFKDDATPEQIKMVEKSFSALPSKINTIIGYEWGTNISPENLAQGYTHCFLVTFKNAAGRDYYLPHAAHKEFGQKLTPYLDKVMVIDFIGQ